MVRWIPDQCGLRPGLRGRRRGDRRRPDARLGFGPRRAVHDFGGLGPAPDLPKGPLVGRMRTFVPRLVALTVVWLLATAALTYAAAQKISTPTTTPAAAKAAAAAPVLLSVPDVRRQAYTFAKGTLSDAGFAWRVTGPVRGYASNKVIAQTPPAGTQVLDTGAPMIVLRLVRSGAQLGVPVRSSAVRGTRIRLAALASNEVRTPARKAKKAVVKKTVTRKAAAVVKANPKVVVKKHPARVAAKRPPAFLVAGARHEPLAEP